MNIYSTTMVQERGTWGFKYEECVSHHHHHHHHLCERLTYCKEDCDDNFLGDLIDIRIATYYTYQRKSPVSTKEERFKRNEIVGS